MFAVSQGAMAVECRQGDEATLALLNKIHDHTTTICCVAERAYLKQLEGGCSVPVSTFTEINEDNQLHIRGGVFSIDGKESVEHTVNTHLDFPPVDIPDGPSFVGLHCQTPSKKNQYTSAWAAGVQLAEEMIKNGADSILAVAKAATKHQIMEEHERMKLEKQLKQQQQLQQQLSGSEAGASSSSAHNSQMSAR